MNSTRSPSGQVILIDGKTLRQSFDKAGAKSVLHMVSAWATANKISLGQVAVAGAEQRDHRHPQVARSPGTAAGGGDDRRQGLPDRDRREDRREEGRDYVLAVKGNQGSRPFHEGIIDFFLDQMEDDFARVKVGRHETKEKGHGRIEHRTYLCVTCPDDLPDASRWAGPGRIGVAISDHDAEAASSAMSPCYLHHEQGDDRLELGRQSHWGIENSLHWQLDMSFGEDRAEEEGPRRRQHGSVEASGIEPVEERAEQEGWYQE